MARTPMAPEDLFQAAQKPFMWFFSAERLQAAAEIIMSDQVKQEVQYFRAVDQAGNEAVAKASTSPSGLAPWLISRNQLVQLARHPDFSVRSSAASICMDLARIAPNQAPVDLLMLLSRYDEDWYVQAPANAALKTLVRSIPAVLQIFFGRLNSEERQEREHAASQLLEIAQNEPELLDRSVLKEYFRALARRRDSKAGFILKRAIKAVGEVAHKPKYPYGL